MSEQSNAQQKSQKIARLCGETCKRTAIVTLEAMVVVAILLALVMGFGVWRLKSGPVNMDFAKDYVIESLDSSATSIKPSLESVSLYWPDLKGPLLLGLDQLSLRDENGNVLIEIDQASMSFSRGKLLIGQLSPKRIFIASPSFRVVRTEDDAFLFNYNNDGQTIARADDQADLQEDTALTTRILEIVARPGTEDASDLPLADLQGVEIESAKVMVEDRKLGITWFLPDIDMIFESTDEGMNTELFAPLPGALEDTSIAVSGHYDWDTQKIDIKANLRDIHTNIFARKIPQVSMLNDFDLHFDAQIEAVLGPDFVPERAAVSLESEGGSFWVKEYSDAPRAFDRIAIVAEYDHISRKLSADDVTLVLPDVTITAAANVTHDIDFSAFTGSVSAGIAEIANDKLDALWPVSLKDDNSYDWVVEKQSDGVLKDVKFSTDFDARQDANGAWEFQDKNLKTSFAVEGMSVDYRSPLPPVQDAYGTGVFDLDNETLLIDVERGTLGGLEIENATLDFRNIIQKGKGVARLDIDLKGALSDAFRYLENEPIGLDEEIHFDLDAVKGEIDFNVKMEFPTIASLKTEQIQLDITGQAQEVFVPDLVNDLPVEGGPLELAVNNEYYTVSGVGTIDGREADFVWTEFLDSEGKEFRNQVQVSMQVDEDLRDHFGIDLSTFIEGPANIEMTYTDYQNQSSDAALKIDLTPSTVFLMPFGFDKPAGKKATASLTAYLEKGELKRISDLFVRSAEDLLIEDGALSFVEGPDGTRPDKGNLKNFSVGQTTAQLEFQQEESGLLKFKMDGPVLDLRPFMSQDENKKRPRTDDQSPIVVSITTRKMQTSDTGFVDDAKIFAALDGQGRFNQLEMDARSGSGDIYLRFKPNPEKTGDWNFRLEVDDAGATLKAFDTYKNMVGGTLVVTGTSAADNPRNMIGSAQINDFRVVDAPALAKILGALSAPGLDSLLQGEGIGFTRLEAQYEWEYHKEGSLLRMRDGRTSGNALGLTFEGELDNADMTMDISGTIVPIAGVNRFLSSIPVIGEILSGGSDSVFAATYKMEGPAEEPRVVVNPLAALTPGILRRILFE